MRILWARLAGLTSEALYKAFRASSQPRFYTIHRVCNVLAVRLVAQTGSASSWLRGTLQLATGFIGFILS